MEYSVEGGGVTREELIQMPGYWTGQIQLSLYRAAESFMTEHHMNRTQLAAYLGVSKGYVSQLLNGDYNYSISKLVELAIKLNYVPNLELKPMVAKTKKEQPKVVVRRMSSQKRQTAVEYPTMVAV